MIDTMITTVEIPLLTEQERSMVTELAEVLQNQQGGATINGVTLTDSDSKLLGIILEAIL